MFSLRHRYKVWPFAHATGGALAVGLLVSVMLVAAACVPPGAFQRSAFEGRTLAVIATPDPPPIVFHERLARVGVAPYAEDGRAPEGYEEVEVERAERLEAQLREAVANLAVTDTLARELGARTANALQMELVANPDEADVLLDVRVLDFGLTTDGFTSGATTFIDADVALLYPDDRDEPLWAFFPGQRGGPTFSGRLLLRVESEQLLDALRDHVRWVADRYERTLREDFR